MILSMETQVVLAYLGGGVSIAALLAIVIEPELFSPRFFAKRERLARRMLVFGHEFTAGFPSLESQLTNPPFHLIKSKIIDKRWVA